MAQLSPLFAKQPIFDRSITTVAYELLFRSSHENFADITDGDHASSHVLLYAFGQNRVDEVIGNVPAYINFTPQLLATPPPLPADKLVIEVLETVTPTSEVIEGIKSLKKRGYKIALDDFFINKETKALMSYADIVKIDVLSLSEKQVQIYVNHLRPLGITLLAEKIETYESFQQCFELGFDLFQGYFLAKPQIIEGQRVATGKQAIVRLLAIILSPEAEIKDIVEAISVDPRLSVRILKIVNSSACHTPCEIHSLNQAVTMLGINQIRAWATFLLLSVNDPEKPRELSFLCVMRAKFCELLAAGMGDKTLAEKGFTAGTLSTIDAFLDCPLSTVLDHLTLSEDIKLAVEQKSGPLGEVLQLVLLFEQAAWDKVFTSTLLVDGVLDEEFINQSYKEASGWALQVLSSLS